jgi:predicted nucleic acid-binding protein
VEAILAVPQDHRFISALTLGELLYGLERKPGADRLRRRLEADFLPLITVLPFDAEAARIYARIRAQLERAGVPLSEADLQIAAIALSRGLRLLTGNARHFRRIEGLELVEF